MLNHGTKNWLVGIRNWDFAFMIMTEIIHTLLGLRERLRNSVKIGIEVLIRSEELRVIFIITKISLLRFFLLSVSTPFLFLQFLNTQDSTTQRLKTAVILLCFFPCV